MCFVFILQYFSIFFFIVAILRKFSQIGDHCDLRIMDRFLHAAPHCICVRCACIILCQRSLFWLSQRHSSLKSSKIIGRALHVHHKEYLHEKPRLNQELSGFLRTTTASQKKCLLLNANKHIVEANRRWSSISGRELAKNFSRTNLNVYCLTAGRLRSVLYVLLCVYFVCCESIKNDNRLFR